MPKALVYSAYPLGTPVESGGFSITIAKVQKLKSIGYSTAKAGNILIDVEVLLQNINRSEKTPYNPMYFSLKDGDGFLYNSSLMAIDPSLKSGDLNKGDQVRGHIVFEVSEKATNLVLSYKPIVLFGDYKTILITLIP